MAHDPMTIFSSLMRESRILVMAAAITGLFSGLCGAGIAVLIGETMRNASPLPSQAWIFFGLCLLYLVFKSSSELLLVNITQGAVLQLRVGLTRKLLQTPLAKLQSLGKHELLAILTADIGTFVAAFQMMPQAFGNAIVIIACFAYMAWLSLTLFALLGVFLVVGVLSYHFAERAPLRKLEALRQQLDVLYKGFRSLVEGTKELQLNRKRGEHFVRETVARAATDSKRMYVSAMSAYVYVSNLGTLLFYIVIGLLLFIVPLWLPLGASTLISFTLVLMFLIRPISEMASALPMVRQANVAWKKISQLDVALSNDSPAGASEDPFVPIGQISLELKGVTHGYEPAPGESHFTVGPIDLSLSEGEVVFLTGGNGGGKTTLSMLLLGLYRPEAGTIALNGVCVTDENVDQYRQYFSAVFADFHLFDYLFESDVQGAEARAIELLHVFGMSQKVSIAEGRFSRLDLSTGQRKRLALISAFLEYRPIHVYDEWAADQDPAFRRIFYTILLPELKAQRKTVLVITHDDAYFHHADRIIQLDAGKLQQVAPEFAFARDEFTTQRAVNV